jgi:hypothetical protein
VLIVAPMLEKRLERSEPVQVEEPKFLNVGVLTRILDLNGRRSSSLRSLESTVLPVSVSSAVKQRVLV